MSKLAGKSDDIDTLPLFDIEPTPPKTTTEPISVLTEAIR